MTCNGRHSPFLCHCLCVYRQGMVESYYASPRKVSAIHYFCAPAPGCGSGWNGLIASIRWSGIIRNSVVCLIGQIKNVTTRCVTTFHLACVPERFVFPLSHACACLDVEEVRRCLALWQMTRITEKLGRTSNEACWLDIKCHLILINKQITLIKAHVTLVSLRVLFNMGINV